MTICPFCHFNNEDGALFCEQCKSDLTGAVPVAVPASAIPVAEAMPVEAELVNAEPFPMVAEAMPMLAEAIPEMPSAEPVIAEAMPVLAEAVPVAAVPLEPLPAAIVEAIPAAGPVAEAAPSAPPPVAASAQAAPTPPPVGAAAPAAGGALPAGAQPKLIVLRGVKRNAEFPIYEGPNFIGRADEKPVDIDLEDQEPPDRVWCSRQHACIHFEENALKIEDLNSANGTYVNRQRIYPGTIQALAVNDIVQIGNVQMKVVV